MHTIRSRCCSGRKLSRLGCPVLVREVMTALRRLGQPGLARALLLLAHERNNVVHAPIVDALPPAAGLQKRQRDVRQLRVPHVIRCHALHCASRMLSWHMQQCMTLYKASGTIHAMWRMNDAFVALPSLACSPRPSLQPTSVATYLPCMHAIEHKGSSAGGTHLDVHQTGCLPVVEHEQRLADIGVPTTQLYDRLPHLAVRHRQRCKIPVSSTR